jgi:Na+/melibiose symporter-like transporter
LNAITNAYPTSISWLLLSLGAAGAMIIMPVVTGDVIDNDELITGKRREGVYGGFNAIITKPAISIANAIFLWVIADFGYVANPPSGHQTDFAKLGILIAFTLIPAIFTLITTIVMKWYSLDGPEWKRKKEEINSHEKKLLNYYKMVRNATTQYTIENLDSHSGLKNYIH